jgi:hypothetical protein
VGLTTDKGEIGEAEVIADLRRRGHGVAIPFGHPLPFDLVLVRGDTGVPLERVQVKYTTSDGRVVKVRCSSYSTWVSYRYQATTVDWLAAFDASGRRVYYIHSCQWDGSTTVNLRLEPTANNQATFVRWAVDFTAPIAAGAPCRGS